MMKQLHESWIAYLTEGIHDKGILKAVFMAGGAGSGKSTVSSYILDYDKDQLINTMTQSGLKISNIDIPYVVLLKKIGVDPRRLSELPKEEFDKINYGPGSTREKARALVNLLTTSYEKQKLGILIDGTGANRSKVEDYKTKLEQQGYDCLMIYVDVDLDVALKRNKARRERSLPDNLIKDLWTDVRGNLNYYSELFGNNFVYVNNNVMDMDKLRQAKRRVTEFLQSPIQNPVGKHWVDSKTQSM